MFNPFVFNSQVNPIQGMMGAIGRRRRQTQYYTDDSLPAWSAGRPEFQIRSQTPAQPQNLNADGKWQTQSQTNPMQQAIKRQRFMVKG